MTHKDFHQMSVTVRKLLIGFLATSVTTANAGDWPGLPPDCWPRSRMVHSMQDLGDRWKKQTIITTRTGRKPPSSQLSPNHAYGFVVADGQSRARITVYAEKDHLVELRLIDPYGLSEVRWVNEKLIFMRAWWGRIAATDLIFDVENEKIIYSESVTDGTLAYQQYHESCPILGCECIRKN